MLTLYNILANGAMFCVVIEAIAMLKEGLVVLKRKSSKDWCRTTKLMKFGVLGWQSSAFIVGFCIAKNNYLPIATMVPIAGMYMWHIWLAFRYKDEPFNPFIVR